MSKNQKIAVLVTCYSRSRNLVEIFKSIPKSQTIYVSIDPAKIGDKSVISEQIKIKRIVQQCQGYRNIEIINFKKHLGIRYAIPRAVTKILKKYEWIVIIEDDVIPSKNFYKLATESINELKSNKKIGHISFYNCVPDTIISNPKNLYRFSIYPESYAWATSKYAWGHYSDRPYLSFKKIIDLQKITDNKYFVVAWGINFLQTKFAILDTWAFRWIFSLWKANLRCVSLNLNLVRYTGQDDGTHTITKQSWKEIKTTNEIEIYNSVILPGVKEDIWLSKYVFALNFTGVIKLILSLVGRPVISFLTKRF